MKKTLKRLMLGSMALLLLITADRMRADAANVDTYCPSIPAQYVYRPYTGFQFSQEWYDGIEDGIQVFHINYENDSDTVIFYYYGGCFISSPLDQHWQFFNQLADNSDAEIIVPIYPMSYFQSSDDRYTMLLIKYIKWKLENPDKRVIFAGDSAGGNLAIGMTQRLKALQLPLPEKLLLISPWVDLSDSSSVYDEGVDADLQQLFLVSALLYAGDIPREDGRISVTNGDLTGFPETMVIAGGLDQLYRDIVVFSDKLESSGVVTHRHFIPGFSHSYPVMYNQACGPEIKVFCEYIMSRPGQF